MLTERAIKNLKVKEKVYRVKDERSMYVEVRPTGAKYYIFRYRRNGKGQTASLGRYPDVTLKEARLKRDKIRLKLEEGVFPISSTKKKESQEKAEKSNKEHLFRSVAVAWYKHALKKHRYAKKTRQRKKQLLRQDVFPAVGMRDIAVLSQTDLTEIVQKVAARSVDQSHRCLTMLKQIVDFALATGKCERDITAGISELLPILIHRHHRAITDTQELGHLLRCIDGCRCSQTVKTAMWMQIWFFLRHGEARFIEWSEVFFSDRVIIIPGRKMKGLSVHLENREKRPDHMVPLSVQACELLKAQYEISGDKKYVLSGHKTGRPISDMTVNNGLKSMGFQCTTHGFRATARTLLDENMRCRVDLIEHQLGHTVRDAQGRAYNRTAFLEDRAQMMQQWCDYLDELKEKC